MIYTVVPLGSHRNKLSLNTRSVCYGEQIDVLYEVHPSGHTLRRRTINKGFYTVSGIIYTGRL